VSRAADLAEGSGEIRRQGEGGEFCWTPSMTDPLVRSRQYLPAVSRKVDYISPEEIAAAVRICLDRSYGMTREELIRATGRVLGFERLGTDQSLMVDACLHDLAARRQIVIAGDRVRLA
jgi:hypothetical protein